jgi:hypothetical protein
MKNNPNVIKYKNGSFPNSILKAAEDSFNIKLVMRLIIAPQITTRPIKFNK